MAKSVSQLLAPSGIYRRTPRLAVKAWVNSPESRFAATKEADGLPWAITHRRSGAAITSATGILSSRDEALAIIAKFEAAGFDLAPFDRLPEVTPDSTIEPNFPADDLPHVRPMVDRLRAIARGEA